MFIYLDETGNLTKNNGQYFIVGSFTVGDPKRVHNAYRRWQRSKFPRQIKYQAEVKFNNPNLTDDMRLQTLKHLTNQDIRIFYTFLNIKNIPEQYREKEGKFKTGVLYTEIIGETLELYMPITETEFRVFRDQKSLKGVTQTQFNEILKARILPQLPAKSILQIQAVDSTTSSHVQVADWVCGALARYHEGKEMGEEFYNVLKGNIVQAKELFSEYWTKKWKK